MQSQPKDRIPLSNPVAQELDNPGVLVMSGTHFSLICDWLSFCLVEMEIYTGPY